MGWQNQTLKPQTLRVIRHSLRNTLNVLKEAMASSEVIKNYT